MKSFRKRFGAFVLFFGFSLLLASNSNSHVLSQDNTSRDKNSVPAEAQTKARLQEAYGQLPLFFIENEGQVDKRVKFYEKGSGHSTFFTKDGIYLSISSGPKNEATGSNSSPSIPHSRSAHLKLIPLGGNKDPEIVPEGVQKGRGNVFLGNDRAKWKTNIPTYRAAVYKEIYPGVDMKFYGNNRQLEYDIIVKPGADPSKIRLGYEGIKALTVTEKGDLEIGLKEGKLIQRKPQIYQEINGTRVKVDGKFKIKDSKPSPASAYGFEVAAYDKRYPLIIDPTLLYSTFVGALGWDTGYGIAVDGSGNAYLTGHTDSPSFPATPGAYDISCGTDELCNGDFDAFVVKLNPGGTGLLYATYIGGSATDAFFGGRIAVDSSGNAYVTGHTNSPDFPTTPGAYDTTCGSDGLCDGGNYDVYISKLDPTGSILLYSSYLAQHAGNYDPAIAVDISGYAYVSWGMTAKIDTNASGAASLVYYSPYGGSEALAVDASGNAYFPYNLGLAKLGPTGSSLLYTVSLGGNSSVRVRGVAADAGGNAYVTGEVSTINPDDPPALFTTPTAFDTSFNGGTRDAFVAKLDPSGAVLYSTYLGGSDDDTGRAIAVDSWGNAYITGYVTSTNYPTTAGSIDTTFNGGFDSFLSMVNPNAAGTASLRYSAYLGGTNSDFGYAIAVGASNAYLTGQTGSGNFPTTAGAFDRTLNDPVGDNSDAFVSKIAFPDLVMTAITPNAGTANGGSTLSVTDTVNNQGEGSTSVSFRVAYHLSTDSIYGNGDDVAITTFRIVSTLAGGALSTATTNLAIPATISEGVYHVCAFADGLNAVVEPNENSNTLCSTSTVTVPPPDLVMTVVSTTATAVAPGKTFPVSNTVKNQGGSKAGAFTIAFHLSSNTTYGDGDDITLTPTRSVTTLAAGASSAATTTVTVPASTPLGVYHVCAMADSGSTVAESNEGNNSTCTGTTIQVTLPDLVMTAVTPNAGTVNRGSKLSVSNTVQNIGLVSSAGSRIAFRLSVNTTYGDGDDVAISTYRSAGALAAGASSAATSSLSISSSTPVGTYYVCAMADSLSAVAETNEGNNTLCSGATVMVQ
jgi:hypothetical protein